MALKMSFDAPAKTWYVFDPEVPEVTPVSVTHQEMYDRMPVEDRDTYIGTYAPVVDGLVMSIAQEKLGAASRRSTKGPRS